MGAFQIINAIVRIIATEFPEITIYDETIEQGFKRPCFFVEQIRCDQRPQLYMRSERKYTVQVTYFTDDKTRAFEQSVLMGEKLLDLLEFIDFETGKARGKNIKYYYKEGALRFDIEFMLYAERENTDVDMRLLEQQLRTKE